MKAYEILKKENIGKKYKDNKGDIWEVVKHMENLVLSLANVGAKQTSIVNMYYLDEIFKLNFIEV
ncbi:hypothetical protein FDB50_15555 [Clostridium botulinum]|uniref:Uncharacterized protein n=1 Tax=Clostridium botulinum TaxID=1491 RepID=A0A846JTY0_CLOBO|nr:hypothetical protein [Clostridium botulinum]NFN36456.1 hypothetical protein [Clostridium botulinum]